MSKLENTSGFLPCEYKVLVRPDKVEESRGQIIIPAQIRDKELREREDVTLIAVGGTAFTEPVWGEPTPKPGDRVKIAKYAGYFFKGADGEWYQVCNDKDVAGILVAEPEEKELHDTDQPDLAGDGAYAHLRSV
jgi:co-chaperonin GroES (HSP10)